MKNMKKAILTIAAFAMVFALGKMNASAADYNSSNNTWLTVNKTQGTYPSESTDYVKYVAPNTGKLTVTIDGYTGYLALCNSSKKVISISTDYKNGTWVYAKSTDAYLRNVTFGVKKGTTYYIRMVGRPQEYVADYTNRTYTYTWKVKATTTKISEKSGSKKSKAKTVKAKKTVSGTLLAGSSTQDWYKFKLTKNKKIKIYLNGDTNAKYKITIYKGSKKVSGGENTIYRGFSSRYTSAQRTISSIGKFTKGTYYVKIQRIGTSSGWYSLKWK